MMQALNQYYPVEAMKLMDSEIHVDHIPLNDPKTFEMICAGDLTGIFQLDNIKVSKPIIARIQPGNIYEIAAVTALIRPGSGQVENYIEAKNDISKRKKIDPRIDRWLNNTYGIILFQEQSMQLLSTMLKVSFGQADLIRRALEKPKKYPEKFKEIQDTFIKRSIENGFTPIIAQHVKDMIDNASAYSFNASKIWF